MPMPFVTVQTVKGILDDDQKRKLHQRLTEVMIEIEGQGRPDFSRMVFIKIEEQDPDHWSFGGVSPSAESIAQAFGAIGTDGKRVSKPGT
jgi:4-oxalocrotonate tautomerase